MAIPTEADLAEAITIAARAAFSELFERHREDFYYAVLTTTGEAHPPTLAAWSVEALRAAVAESDSPDEDRHDLEWSYADSPYFEFGAHHFREVDRLFLLRPQLDPVSMTEATRRDEYDLRLRAMETALQRLDNEGIFGVGADRDRIMINVEVNPPDHTNTERARRLNPEQSIQRWLREMAEEA